MGIYLRGNIYWGRWEQDGKRHRKSLGTENRREAERKFEELRAESPEGLTVRDILARPVWNLNMKNLISARAEHMPMIAHCCTAT